MSVVIEHLIRNSDNQIKLVLTEDGDPITGAWTELDIFIDEVNINRTIDGDGVTLSAASGELVITPGDLTTNEKTALNLLDTNRSCRVLIVVYSSQSDDGNVFGGEGSEKIFFKISDRPG